MKRIAHPLIALALTALIGLLTGNWWAGAALACGLYIGRENAQAEYRWIETYGLGRRANMPLLGAFEPRVWSLKSLLDVLLPILATVALVLAVTL